MRRRIPLMLLLCQVLVFFHQFVYADTVEECRVSCDNEFSACIEQLSPFAAINPGVMAVKEAECKQRVEACHAGCETFQLKEEKEESIEEKELSPPE